MNWTNRIFPLDFEKESPVKASDCPTRERLGRGFARLRDIQQARVRNPSFGRSEEYRIIWRELLDLELQYIDEHLGRMVPLYAEWMR